MARSARTLLLGVAALVAVLVGGAALRLASLDPERIRAEVQTHLSDGFGLEVGIGDVRFALGWRLRIAAADVRIANLPGRAAAHLLEAERVALSLRLWPLLRGRLECDEIALHGATLHLEGDDPPDSAPKPDWDALKNSREDRALRLALREVEVERLVVWVGREQDPRRISVEELSLEESGSGELGNVRLRGEVDAGRFRLEGRIGPAAALTDPALGYRVQLEGSALGAEWEVDASLQEPLALRGIEVAALSVSTRGAEVQASGRVADARAFRGVDLAVQAKVSDAALLEGWLGSRLPPLGAFDLAGSLYDTDGSLGFEGKLLATAQGGVDIDLEIVAGDLRGGGDIVVDAEISAAGLQQIGDLLGVGLPPVGPASWNGSLRGRSRSLSLDGTLTVARTTIDVQGHLQEDAAGRRNLRAALRSSDLRLADFGISPGGWAGAGDDRLGWARSQPALDFVALRGFDATLTFDAEKIRGRRGYLADVTHFDLDLRQGLLRVRYEDSVGESPLAVRFSADVRGETPVLELNVESRRFDLIIPAAQLEDDPRLSGTIDFEAALHARGLTADALRRSLSGSVLITGRDGTLASRYARAFFQDLFQRILESGSERPPELWRCAKADLVIEQGVIRARELFADLDGVHLVGRGSVDIAAGRWDLVIRPRIHGRGLIGGGATIEVAGPLAKPTFRARPLSVPVSIGETLASRILSPLELAARPITGTHDPCEGLP